MRKLVLTALTSLAWLLASPTLQLPEFGWVEVGATPAAAQAVDEAKEPAKAVKDTKKKSAKRRAGRHASAQAESSPAISPAFIRRGPSPRRSLRLLPVP